MKRTSLLALLAGSCLAPTHSLAQCPTINFENAAAGTAITTQYPGITFSVLPQSCGGDLAMRITTALDGTSSGTRCLRIDASCPSFSAAYMRMVFDDPQGEVTFTLGDWATTYSIRYYSTVAGGVGLIAPPMTVTLEGAGNVPVYRLVRVVAPLHNMVRIEVEAAGDNFEAIDDLTLVDTTPPTARIDNLAFDSCACGTITVHGVACDDDGNYGNDRLEYRRTDAAPGAAWTQIGTFTSPVCVANTLYSWNTAAIAEGFYYLRLTATNACGASTTDQTVVYVDKSFAMPEANVRSPVNNAILGGQACFDGTVQDHCFMSYTVRYRPNGAGAFLPVDPAHAVYATPVTTDGLGAWNTLVGGAAVPDGNYQVEIRGTDSCGNTSAVVRNVVIDNTLPMAAITSPTNCTYRCGTLAIQGMATDAHMGSWVLDYIGGNQHNWSTPIAQGNANIAGLLANWDTSGLTPCAYVLRLRVSDAAAINCGSQNNFREYLVPFHIGAYANCDNSVIAPILNANDFQCFLNSFAGGCT